MKKINFSGKEIARPLSLLWLLIYFSGIVAFQTIHRFGHEHAVVSHSKAQESDSCHRAIYHHETDHGCKHKAHFVVKTSCEFCDAYCSPVQENHNAQDYKVSLASYGYSNPFRKSVSDQFFSDTPARAPPAQV